MTPVQRFHPYKMCLSVCFCGSDHFISRTGRWFDFGLNPNSVKTQTDFRKRLWMIRDDELREKEIDDRPPCSSACDRQGHRVCVCVCVCVCVFVCVVSYKVALGLICSFIRLLVQQQPERTGNSPSDSPESCR